MKTLTAKKYLQQIKTLDIKIKQRENQYKELKEAASSPGSMQYNKEIVQTSKAHDRLEKLVIQYIGLEQEVEQEKFRLQALKQKIIDEIQSLDNDKFIDLLYKRYVEYKSYERIAVEMNYGIDNVYIVHRKALKAFGQKFTVNYT